MSKKANGNRVYVFTIEYNNRTCEIIDLHEEMRETEPSFYYGDVTLEDYWDDEAIDLMYQMDEIGIT